MTTPQPMSITLYASPMSSALPVLQAVAELDVPHELIVVDLAAGEQRTPAFLALNPNGKVPTLVVDGTPMFEALAIMHWLGDRFGVQRGVWPAPDAPERLTALSWSTWMYVTFSAALKRLLNASSERVPAERHNQAEAQHSAAELQELLGMLDTQLAGRAYLLGDSFSLTDLIVGNGVGYGAAYGAPIEAHANVTGWLGRLAGRDSFKETMAAFAA